MNNSIVIVMPVYQPDSSVPEFMEQLQRITACRIAAVNDGSDECFEPVFQKIQKIPYVALLKHPCNQGKGVALKTAFRWCKENCPNLTGAVTADSDGQHSLEDIVQVVNELTAHPDSLILGCRNFSRPEVPWKSRFGNLLVSWLSQYILSITLSDTQTGLRGIPRKLLFSLDRCRGERFEFETAMLQYAVKQGYPIRSIPISTIYFHRNRQSHFRMYKDSILIFQSLFQNPMKRKQTDPE